MTRGHKTVGAAVVDGQGRGTSGVSRFLTFWRCAMRRIKWVAATAMGVLLVATLVWAAEPADSTARYNDLKPQTKIDGTADNPGPNAGTLQMEIAGWESTHWAGEMGLNDAIDDLIEADLMDESVNAIVQDAQQWLAEAEDEIALAMSNLAAADGFVNSGKGAADIGNYAIAHGHFDSADASIDLVQANLQYLEEILDDSESVGHFWQCMDDLWEILAENQE